MLRQGFGYLERPKVLKMNKSKFRSLSPFISSTKPIFQCQIIIFRKREKAAATSSPVAAAAAAPIVPPQNAIRNGSAYNSIQTNGFTNRVAVVNGTVPVPRQYIRNYSPQQQYHQINSFQSPHHQQMAAYHDPSEIIRLPRGPDGTSAGFMLKR